MIDDLFEVSKRRLLEINYLLYSLLYNDGWIRDNKDFSKIFY